MNKNNLRFFITLLMLMFFCGIIQAETLKVLTQNIWGVPDSVSTRLSAPKMLERKEQFCNSLRSMEQAPDIVLIQELWNNEDAVYMIKNCGYSYYSYQDKAGLGTILNSNNQKLTSHFFETIKNEINDKLRYFGINIDALIKYAICWSYELGVCNLLEDIGVIPNRTDLLQATNWFKDSYVKSGLLILSKYPIESQYRMIYSDRGDLEKILSDLERSVTKSLMLVKVTISGHPLWVANTHLIANYEYKPNEGDYYSKQRSSQFAEALSFIKKIVGNEPVVFGGDFNMGETYPCWDFLREELKSSDIEWDVDNNPTYDGRYNGYAKSNEGKLDHILGMNGVKAKQEGLAFVENPVSDHYGVYKILEIPRY